MWKQEVTPNLDPTVYEGGVALGDWYGMCLATVETAFNTARIYPRAIDAWDATTAKHEDQNFPTGVYFPVWFSGYEGFGHVAFAYINDNGQMNIWTSPYKHVPYFFTGYNSIQELADGYHITYLGWSEDLAGSTLISYQEPVVEVPVVEVPVPVVETPQIAPTEVAVTPIPVVEDVSVTPAPETVTVAVAPAPEVVTRTTSVSHTAPKQPNWLLPLISSILKWLYIKLIGVK